MEFIKCTCQEHGDFLAKPVRFVGQNLLSSCPKCARIRLEKANKEVIDELEVYNRRRTLEDYARRGIEPEFALATLDNYITENESEKQGLKAVTNLVEGNVKKVLLLGSHGTGKTHLACAAAKKLNGIRITMFELANKVRKGYRQDKTDIEVLDDLLRYPFICIDELGRTKGSEAELNWLSYLIDKAHTRGIRLLLISNRHQARNLTKDKQGEAIENFLPNDAISRLRQASKIVEITGRDRRSVMAAV